MFRSTVALSTLCIGSVVALPLGAQSMSTDASFSWSGTVAAGRAVMIRNINGSVRVEHASGNRLEVTAEKRWRRGRPEDVRIVQPTVRGGDVLFCALWNESATCDEDGIHTPRGNDRRNYNNDVSVQFVVRVPDGVRVDISTVNGGLEVDGVSSTVEAGTVNGDIHARSSGGPIHAKTVNGSIDVAMGAAGNTGENLEYETVNGSVTVELPPGYGSQVELSTVNGRVTTDFPVSVVGTLSPRKLRGTIGNGAARLRASTVNGSVTLRKGN